MRYRIAVHQSGEGVSVSVPGLPGCWSQGATEAEALENIEDTIRGYVAVVKDRLGQGGGIFQGIGVTAGDQLLAPDGVEEIRLSGNSRGRGACQMQGPALLVAGLKCCGERLEGRSHEAVLQGAAGDDVQSRGRRFRFVAERVGGGGQGEAGRGGLRERAQRLPVNGGQAADAGLAVKHEDAALGEGLDAGRAEGFNEEGEGSADGSVGGERRGDQQDREERGYH